MKNLRIKKLLTVSYPITALILGFVLGYATVFFGSYIDGIVALQNQGLPMEMTLIIIQVVGLLVSGFLLIISIIKDEVTNGSVFFSMFGICYLGSTAYFTLSVFEIIIGLI